MRDLRLSLLLSAVVCGVAMAEAAAPKWMTDAQAEIKAAQAAGAEQVPAAQDHLGKANAALAKAAKAGGDAAALQGSLAFAEAQLAKNLAMEAKVRADLAAATTQLNALKAQ